MRAERAERGQRGQRGRPGTAAAVGMPALPALLRWLLAPALIMSVQGAFQLNGVAQVTRASSSIAGHGHRTSAIQAAADPTRFVDQGIAAGLKEDLRLRAARLNRGFSASPTQLEDLRSIVTELESLNLETAPTRSRDLLGEWRLDYTDARDVLSLALFPGAIAELGEIFQNIEPGLSMDEFKAANVVELLPRGSAILNGLGMRSAVRYRVLAACNVQNETRLSLVFMGLSAQLEGDTPFGFQPPPLEASLPQELIERLQELAAERVYLDTTYLDKDLRVIRGPTQEIYVLSKVL